MTNSRDLNDLNDLNNLIDDAARRMTAAEPSGHLRTRVVARLGTARRPRQWRWLLAPLVAATAVAIAVLVVREPRVVPGTSFVVPGTTSVVPGTNAVVPGTSSVVPGTNAIVHNVPGVPGVPASSADEIAWQSRALPALEAPEALTLDAIQPEALDIRPLVTKPLSVPALGEDENRHQFEV